MVNKLTPKNYPQALHVTPLIALKVKPGCAPPPGYTIVTRDILFAGRSSKKGYSRKQLALLGVGYPPPMNWVKATVQRAFPTESVEQFIALKDAHIRYPNIPSWQDRCNQRRLVRKMFPNADFHGNCGAKYMTMDGRRIDQGGVPLAWANTGYDLWRIMYGWVEALNKGAMILPPSQRPGVEGYRSAEELLDVNTGPQKKRKKRAVLNGGVI